MRLGLLTLACLFLTPCLEAAEPAYINQKSFLIPLRIDESRQADIRQVNLFVSQRETGPWDPAGTLTPDKEGFPFNAPGDGLYFFKLQVESAQGDREPADLARAPISQRIVVDTVKPVMQIVDAERQGENLAVRWDGREDYPDLKSLKLEYRTPDMPDGLWNTVSIPNPALRSQATFRLGNSGAVSLRLQMQDLAGNMSNPATLDLPAAPGGASGGFGSSASVGGNSPTNATRDSGTGWTPNPGNSPVQPVSSSRNAPRNSIDNLDSPPAGGGRQRYQDLPDSGGPTNPIKPLVQGSGGQLLASSAGPQRNPADADLPPSRPARSAMAKAQLVNSRRVTLDYEARLGPSGLGSVELYLTRDEGQHWEKLNLDPSSVAPVAGDAVNGGGPVRRSLTVDLPGEGRFGFYLVVKSGAGLGKPAPRDGDSPQMMVEVDETPPEANLFAPEPDPKQHDALILRWSASDHNLAANPISLEWAERPTGPWHKIGGDSLPNTPSQYTWRLTSDVPAKVYLRLLVKDLAGNVAKAETAQPILVDLYEPEAQFIGLSGTPRQ